MERLFFKWQLRSGLRDTDELEAVVTAWNLEVSAQPFMLT
jgi:hypothetical protein